MVKGSALAEIAKEFAPASYIFSSADEEKAVESAKVYWERKSKKEQKIIIQYIDAKFDLWKYGAQLIFLLFAICSAVCPTGLPLLENPIPQSSAGGKRLKVSSNAVLKTELSF